MGDVPYVIDPNNVDHYPLIMPTYWQDLGVFNVSSKTAFPWNHPSNVSVSIANIGYDQQSGNVTLYWDDAVISQQSIIMTRALYASHKS